MKAMFIRLALAITMAALLTAFTPAAQASALISGLQLEDYSSSYPQREPSNTYNGTSTENSTNFADNWMTNNTTNGSITWFLGGQYTLDTMDVFNYREGGPATRSAKDVVLSVSDDYGKTFTVVPSNGGTIPASLTQAPTSGTNTPTIFSTGGMTVTNVKLTINNNYGDPSFVGLNEVEFYGTVTHPTVQVPITVSAFSSQYTPDGRLAANTTDGIYETRAVNQMWLSNGSDNLPTITYSLGATPRVLDHLDIWNYNETNFTSRGLDNIEIQLFDASMTSLGLAVNAADGSTTFTLNQNNGNAFGDSIRDGNSIMNALGILDAPAASYFKIITLTNPDGAGFGGLSEVEAFAAAPEPASAGLLIAGGAMLLRRRRRA